MADLIIQLRCDPMTGKKDIVVKLQSDADSLPHEHEQLHRLLVEKLVGKGLLQTAEIGELIIEREEPNQQTRSTPATTPEDQRRAAAQGQ